MTWWDVVEDEFFRAWWDKHGEDERPPNKDTLFDLVSNLLRGRELELARRVNFGEDLALLLVDVEGDAYLVTTASPDTEAEVRFLGPLADGEYTETMRRTTENQLEHELRFRHERLGGDGEIRISMEQAPGSRMRPGEPEARERTQRLREQFQRWARPRFTLSRSEPND